MLNASTQVQSQGEAVTLDRGEAVTLDRGEAVTPDRGEAVTPDRGEAVTPNNVKVVLSLGEIVTPNIAKAVGAFAELLRIGLPIVQEILQGTHALLELFKLGRVSELEYIKRMIEVIKQKTDVTIDETQFRGAWLTMMPEYDSFKDDLAVAIRQTNLILVSHTNPIDMGYLVKVLRQNQIPIKVEQIKVEQIEVEQIEVEPNETREVLVEIAGIPVHLSFHTKMSKDRMIEEIKAKHPDSEIVLIWGPNEVTVPTEREALSKEREPIAVSQKITISRWNKKEVELQSHLDSIASQRSVSKTDTSSSVPMVGR